MGKLYIVQAQPGEWENVTLRARTRLSTAALVIWRADEWTADWLLASGINAPFLSYNQHDRPQCLEQILLALQTGDVAWLSSGLAAWTAEDAALLDELLARGTEVLPVPGASELVNILVLSGLPADRFVFLGTLPVSAIERCALFERVAREPHTLICGVHGAALEAALRDVHTVLGERRVAACRGQVVWRGRAGETPVWTRGRRTSSRSPDSYLVIEGADHEQAWDERRVRAQMRAMLADGQSLHDVARTIAGPSGWRRKDVYEIGLRIEQELAADHRPDERPDPA